MDTPDRAISANLEAIPSVEDRLRLTNTRLLLAQTYLAMKRKAYDALLNWGVNFRELPAYKDQTLIEEAKALPASTGAEKYIEWCRRVEHDIAAHINRRQFRKV